MNDLQNRKKGCFYGVPVGDALGTPIEKKKAGTFVPITDYRDGSPRNWNQQGSKAGEWTDDTSMCLALADSLGNGHSQKDQLDKYVDWYKNGKYTPTGKCYGMGRTTRQALDDFIKTGQLESGLVETRGNGSIMRIAPVAIKYAFDKDLRRIAIESSVTTHNNPVCKAACEYMAVVLGGLIRGLPANVVLDPTWEETARLDLVPEIRSVADGGFLTETVDGEFNVRSSLISGLWAFATSYSFEEAVLKAVNLGNDADTTGAIAGQFAGAYYGFDAIPQRFIDSLAKKDLIEQYLNRIL